MKKILIQFISIFIPKQSWRRAARPYLRSISFKDIKSFYRLSHTKLTKKSVLLIEPNNCHHEVLPGYAYYFHQLGYEVYVITNSWNKTSDLFSLVRFPYNQFYLSHFWFEKLASLPIMHQFTHIVVTSTSYYEITDRDGNTPQSLDILKLRDFKNVFIIEHELKDVEKYKEQTFIEQNKLITLWDFGKGISVNPHHYGIVNPHEKNTTTQFVVVGGIQSHRKNHKLLLDAVTELHEQGINNFKVIVIGNGHLKHIPSQIRQYFEIKGRLSFAKMFKEMQKADFYLPLLDPTSTQHLRYIQTGVTGSVQLILGFNTLPVVQKVFADFYKYDDKNAVVYEESLAEALSTAINMSPSEYQNRKKELLNLSLSVEKQSLENLRQIL